MQVKCIDEGDSPICMQVLKNKMKEQPNDSNKAFSYLVRCTYMYQINCLSTSHDTLQEPGDQYSHLAPKTFYNPYDHLRNVLSDTKTVVEDPYPDLKKLLPIDMVTCAYQIADGMVSSV